MGTHLGRGPFLGWKILGYFVSEISVRIHDESSVWCTSRIGSRLWCECLGLFRWDSQILQLKKYFTFEVQVLDDKKIKRRFRASNYQAEALKRSS